MMGGARHMEVAWFLNWHRAATVAFSCIYVLPHSDALLLITRTSLISCHFAVDKICYLRKISEQVATFLIIL